MAKFAEVTCLSDSPHAKKIHFGWERGKTGERLSVKVKTAVNCLYQIICALQILPDLVVEQARVATNN